MIEQLKQVHKQLMKDGEHEAADYIMQAITALAASALYGQGGGAITFST